ncbi:MAG: hypothetical protein IPL33_10900 [Sphingobacteriales bacterium]|nr:hypothetical protein [Sphingobacteriales bacterium]
MKKIIYLLNAWLLLGMAVVVQAQVTLPQSGEAATNRLHGHHFRQRRDRCLPK